MKKYKICFLFLLCATLLFAGCSGDKFLKTKNTDVDLSTFFNNYTSSLKVFDGVDKSEAVLVSEAERIAYTNYINPYMAVLPEERCIISAVDYFCAINQEGGELRIDTKTRTKLYEYNTVFKQELVLQAKTQTLAENASQIKVVILVESTKNDSQINVWLFYKTKIQNYNVATLIEQKNDAHFTCVFTLNKYIKQTNECTFTYAKNGGKASNETKVAFNESKGCVNYEINTSLTNSEKEVDFKFNKSLYKYSNTAVGVRGLVSFNNSSKTDKYIYEQLSKDFYNRLKLGTVKDEASILSMETMKEDALAKSNQSDSVGFELTYNTQQENVDQENKITYIKYGTGN